MLRELEAGARGKGAPSLFFLAMPHAQRPTVEANHRGRLGQIRAD